MGAAAAAAIGGNALSINVFAGQCIVQQALATQGLPHMGNAGGMCILTYL